MTTDKTQEKDTIKTNGKTTLWITGRIQSVEQVGTTKDQFPILETVLSLPAPDVYTAPKRLCVRSNAKLGMSGEDITIEVEPVLRSWLDKNKKWQHPHHLVALK